MNKIKFLTSIVTLLFVLNGCKEILESVSMAGSNVSDTLTTSQEEFKINIKNLNFDTAIKANADPFPRKLMVTGSCEQANVFDEARFLTSTIPDFSKPTEYLLGVGDILTFTKLNEFAAEVLKWPKNEKSSDYIIGIGDVLTLIQLNDDSNNLGIVFSDKDKSSDDNSNILISDGVVGSDGNILFLGMGNIKAYGRTLRDIRNEVRNILIRNGLAPNFQLEITNFKSKKAFLNIDGNISKIVPINNISMTLREIALTSGLSASTNKHALVTLTRANIEYRFTAGQLFGNPSIEFIIKDKDQINIEIVKDYSTATDIVIVLQYAYCLILELEYFLSSQPQCL